MSYSLQGVKASRWTGTSTLVNTVIQFIQLLILSRLLNPSDYGLMGMISVVIGFAQIYSDVGISNAIINKQDVKTNQLSSLYFLNVASGVIVFLIITVLSPVISMFYQENRLVSPLLLLAIVFLILPIGQQFQILLQKDLKFSGIAKIEMAASILGFVTTILTAWMNYGVFSLVWGQIITAAVKTICYLTVGIISYRPKIRFKLSDTKGFLQFGLYQMGEKTVHFFSTNIDYIIIGKLLGAEALGYYTFAYQLAIIPVLKINPIITQIALPIFAKLQNEKDRLKNGYIKILKYLSFINFPLYVSLIIIAPFLIPTLFGERWNDSIVLIQILCGMGLFRSTISPNSSLMIAVGKANLGFLWTLISMFLLVPAILVGINIGGVKGIAIAYLLIQALLVMLNYLLIIRSILGPCFIHYMKGMSKTLLICFVMAGAVLIVQLSSESLMRITSLYFQVVTAFMIYIVINILFNKDLIKEFSSIFLLEKIVNQKKVKKALQFFYGRD